eukprot:TRINITY_DN3486_c0_g1_i1.p1 TRINITY_DN3486_c0_g1~~TRINITY_DN3486_c0_g1_i1.p1  ORF type:complete len:1904 (+),score=397.79 TRINITY_DN3486_c0_g1_i1:1-5712(+)
MQPVNRYVTGYSPNIYGYDPTLINESQERSESESDDDSRTCSDDDYSDQLLPDFDKTFNERFQYYIRKGDSSALNSLANGFFQTAATYGKMIISEQNIPDHKKELKTKNIGGRAGGSKFLVHGLLFKHSTDSVLPSGRWMYGGDSPKQEYAMKAAGHELNGLSYVMFTDFLKDGKDLDQNLKGFFNYPLLAILDYQGFRLTAMTELPIRKETLVYGSDDGGVNVKFDEEVHDEMKEIAKKLNLRPHLVGDLSNGKQIALCGDLEVHRVADNELYILDTARVFPPEFPSISVHKKIPQSFLFRMLRPELVIQYLSPLSSDGLSSFQNADPNASDMNNDIKHATIYLHEKVIPNFAKWISNNTTAMLALISESKEFVSDSMWNSRQFTDPFLRRLHFNGINIRYLGSVRYHLKLISTDTFHEEFILSLMAIRVIKNYWRKKVRNKISKNTSSTNEACLEATLDVLNSILQSEYFWEEKLVNLITSHFGSHALTNDDIKMLREKIDLKFVIFRVCQLCGICISSSTIKNLNKYLGSHQNQVELVPSSSSSLVSSSQDVPSPSRDIQSNYNTHHQNDQDTFQFTAVDIIDFIPILKYPPVLDYHSGRYFLSEAEKSGNILRKQSYLKAAQEKLASSFSAFPLHNEFRFFYAYTLFLNFKFQPTKFVDIPFIISAFEDRLCEKDEQTNFVVKLNLVIAIFWRMTDQDLEINSVESLIQEYVSPQFRYLFTKQGMENMSKSDPHFIFNLFEDVKTFEQSDQHTMTAQELMKLMPYEDSPECCLTMSQLQNNPIRQIFYLNKAKQLHIKLFNSFVKDLQSKAVNIRSNDTRSSKNMKKFINLSKSVLAVLNSPSSTTSKTTSSMPSTPTKYDFPLPSPSLVYWALLTATTPKPTRLKGWTQYLEEIPHSWWFYYLKLVNYDGVVFTDEFIKTLVSNHPLNFIEFSFKAEITLYTILSTPNLLEYYRLPDNRYRLTNLFMEYLNRMLFAIKRDAKVATTQWLNDFCWLIQILLVRFPELYDKLDVVFNLFETHFPQHCHVLISICLDLWGIVHFYRETLEERLSDIKTNAGNNFSVLPVPVLKQDMGIETEPRPSLWQMILVSPSSTMISIDSPLISKFRQSEYEVQQSIILSILDSGDSYKAYSLVEGNIDNYCSTEVLKKIIDNSAMYTDSLQLLYLILKSKEFITNHDMIHVAFWHVFETSNVVVLQEMLNYENLKHYLSVNALDLASVALKDPQLLLVSSSENFNTLSYFEVVITDQLWLSDDFFNLSLSVQCVIIKHIYQLDPDLIYGLLLTQVISRKKRGILSSIVSLPGFNVNTYVTTEFSGKSYTIPLLCFALYFDLKLGEVLLEAGSNMYPVNPTINQTNLKSSSSNTSSSSSQSSNKAIDLDSKLWSNPLCVASFLNNPDMIYLLANKYDASPNKYEGMGPLSIAAKRGCTDAIEALAQVGAKIDQVDEFNETSLHMASKRGNVKAAEILIKHKADVNFKNSWCRTPLHYAETTDIVKLLVASKAAIDIKDEFSRTPLHVASYHGKSEVVESLILCKADINVRGSSNRTALHFAGSEDVVEKLVKHGLDINTTDEDGKTALQIAAESGKASIINALLLHGAKSSSDDVLLARFFAMRRSDYNSGNEKNETKVDPKNVQVEPALHFAAKRGNSLVLLELLKNNNININQQDRIGCTALHKACREGKIKAVEILLQHKANVFARDVASWSPLHHAVYYGTRGVVDLLLQHGADANAPTQLEMFTPLHYAASKNDISIINSLINHGANIDCRDIHGKTPLQNACEAGKIDIVKSLINIRAHINTVSNNGYTPLHSAIEADNSDIISLLILNGASYNSSDKNTSSSLVLPLHLAASLGKVDAVVTLLGLGADPYEKDESGYTPLNYAIEEGHDEVAQILLSLDGS